MFEEKNEKINQLKIFLKHKKRLFEKKIKYYVFWLNKFFLYDSKSPAEILKS